MTETSRPLAPRPRCSIGRALAATLAALAAGGLGFGASMLGWMMILEPASLRDGAASALVGFAVIAGLASLPLALPGTALLYWAGNRGVSWRVLCGFGVVVAIAIATPFWIHNVMALPVVALAGSCAGLAAAAVLRPRTVASD